MDGKIEEKGLIFNSIEFCHKLIRVCSVKGNKCSKKNCNFAKNALTIHLPYIHFFCFIILNFSLLARC
jgi:hypothetical protein